MKLMTDIETLGVDTDIPCPVILSVGACVFDNAKIVDTFYQNIDPKSCKDAGMVANPATARWWMTQSKEAREALEKGQMPIRQGLEEFIEWTKMFAIEELWANSPSFDYSIIKRACDLTGIDWPYKFWLERDVRTIKDWHTPWIPREGTHHNAEDDAVYQAKLVIEAREKLYEWQAKAYAWDNKIKTTV